MALAFADAAPLLLPPPVEQVWSDLHLGILDALSGGALFFRQITVDAPEQEIASALWDLVWGGLVGNDTLTPVRALLSGGSGAHRSRPAPGRSRYQRPGRPSLGALRQGPPTVAGRWHLVAERDLDPTRRAAALADALLERHGVVTRGAVAAEGQPGGFAAVYPVLAGLEERGAARRGYFVEGLGAAQFALPGAVDRLRSYAGAAGAGIADDDLPRREGQGAHGARTLVLAATDPANPYGAALEWPADGGGHRPGRKAGALVVLVDGALALYVERGGRTLLTFAEDEPTLAAAAEALAQAVRRGALGSLSVERADGEAVHDSALARALATAGFKVTPRGLRLRT
jgi:ATP-dependent Lhr-like helicase